MDYWPSYSKISPQSRAAYLRWLADGRRTPGTYIGYVFLYFYGLERRVVDMLGTNNIHPTELDAINTELDALDAVYGNNGSFHGYAAGLRNLIGTARTLDTDEIGAAPARNERTWNVPYTLHVGLGSMAAEQKPIPVEWALAWIWYHPTTPPRTPQRRCREQFDTLFAACYTDKHGTGIVLRPGKKHLSSSYRAASLGIGTIDLDIRGIPAVFDQTAPLKSLAAIAESVSNDLEPYSRFIGRRPDDGGTLAAAATLPPAVVLNTNDPHIRELRDWAENHLNGKDTAVVNGGELVNRWGQLASLRKADSASAAALLQHLGYGIEPDVRLAGPTLGLAPIVLFRARPDTPQTAGTDYAVATLAAHLGITVAAADGRIDDTERDQLSRYLRSAFGLTAGEQHRLHAHTEWLASNDLKLTGLKARLVTLTQPQREAFSDFLLGIAAADGIVTPTEVSTLTRLHKMLGLDPDQVPNRIHHLLTGTPPHPPAAQQPVTVQTSADAETGYTIPGPPQRYRGRHHHETSTDSAELTLSEPSSRPNLPTPLQYPRCSPTSSPTTSQQRHPTHLPHPAAPASTPPPNNAQLPNTARSPGSTRPTATCSHNLPKRTVGRGPSSNCSPNTPACCPTAH